MNTRIILKIIKGFYSTRQEYKRGYIYKQYEVGYSEQSRKTMIIKLCFSS